jgi:hypothetical protein
MFLHRKKDLNHTIVVDICIKCPNKDGKNDVLRVELTWEVLSLVDVG